MSLIHPRRDKFKKKYIVKYTRDNFRMPTFVIATNRSSNLKKCWLSDTKIADFRQRETTIISSNLPTSSEAFYSSSKDAERRRLAIYLVCYEVLCVAHHMHMRECLETGYYFWRKKLSKLLPMLPR